MATIGLSEADRAAVERFRREVIEPSQTQLVVLDFFATWCGPCKQLAPVLEKVAADYADRGVVLRTCDIDSERLIADQFRIQSVPTVYALFAGQPVADLTPYRTESALRAALDQLLAQLPIEGARQAGAAAVEPLVEAGEAALADGAVDEALALFSEAEALAPGQPAVAGGLARALAASGSHDAARALLDSLDAEAGRHPSVVRARAALEIAGPDGPADADSDAALAAKRQAVDARPDDLDARFDLALALMGAGQRDLAADQLLDLIARDRGWNDGAAKAKLLTLLEAAGLEDPWARTQRRRLSAILFT